ncbi:MAG: ATP-binding protein [Pseudomonadota bacterium]
MRPQPARAFDTSPGTWKEDYSRTMPLPDRSKRPERVKLHERLVRFEKEGDIPAPQVAGYQATQKHSSSNERNPQANAATQKVTGQAHADAIRLIGAVSHEMRNPLNGILGMAHLLADTDLDAEQRSYLDAVTASGEMLLTLVNDLLDLTALQSGAVAISESTTDIVRIVNQTLEMAAPIAHAKKLDLGSFIDPGLDYPVKADARRIRQILTNLVSNAIKFTAAGGVRLDARLIDIAGDGRDPTIQFDVIDTGEGISKADKELIFKPFGRTKSAQLTGVEGTGLGLPLSRGLAEAMGGTLQIVSSEQGAGSHIRFCLPVHDDAFPVTEAECPLDGQRILVAAKPASAGIVSPELDALVETLGSLGASVTLIDEAAKLDGPPADADHVLVDSGFDHAMLWARLCLPGTGIRPIVLLRSDGRSELENYRSAGFGGYLVRPVRRASLLSVITHRFEDKPNNEFRTDPADSAPQPNHKTSNKRILLADDSEVNTLLVRAALERLGHTVITVNDGARAIAMVHDQKEATGSAFDLVLLDLSMPVLDGFAAARQIRARGYTGRILAISGNTDPNLQKKLADAGFNGFAQKPITPIDLEQLIDDHD